jgi:GTP-binding protein HflX
VSEQAPSDARERVVLVGVELPGQHGSLAARLEELALLCDTAGCDTVATVTQSRQHPDGRTYIGKGKLAELVDAVAEHEADVAVFDSELTPAQARNVAQAIERRVVDRTQLILDIFARRASTRLARDQVELAQLQYELPRLRRMWTHLSRIEGGLGMRGPGETQLEVDRRRARERIHHLHQRLAEAERQKEVSNAAREGTFLVSLVGYTNVGKSTLMNALTAADVFVENRLFATLDATTRRLALDGHEVLLSDTVGFIRDLPHTLVASFHATLAEVRDADLLLHVVDIASPELDEQIAAVHDVLAEIGAADTPRLLVCNKVDAVAPEVDAPAIAARCGDGLLLSARTGEGLDELRARLVAEARQRHRTLDLEIPYHEGKTTAYVESRARVLVREFGPRGVRLKVLVSPADASRLARWVTPAAPPADSTVVG